MIVTMKRLTLLCLNSDRDAALRRLQDMGVVHITNLRPPDSRALETSRNHFAYIKRVLETMPKKTTAAPSGLTADIIVSLVWTMLQDKKDIEDSLADLHVERARIAPFGSFDPAQIEDLRKHGVFIKLYIASPGAEIKAPDGAAVVEVNRDKTGVYLALFSRKEETLPFTEFRLPERSLKDMDEAIVEYQTRLADCVTSLRQHEGDHHVVAALRDQLDDSVHFLEARDGMGSAAPVAYLRGFVPAIKSDAILAAARTEGWGVQLEDPEPDDDVPTLIENPRWIRPIEAVLRGINVLPGYREVDMSMLFLVYFSIFFAILIGDAGYGALFLVATLWARRKLPSAPAAPFQLLALNSLCTIAWGVITGTYFGILHLPPLLNSLVIDWFNQPENMMSLCFLIGAVHLTMAHLWNIIRLAPNPVALSQLGWIGMTWAMYFWAHQMVLNVALPSFVNWMMLVCAVLILAFMTPPAKFKDEWFQHVMFPLSVISNFVDVVSYIRLFAVGFASLAVAQAFNAMALDVGFSTVLAGFGAALILLAGHTLNIILGFMGILVHGVRLNTLEFSSHLGVQWSGHAYEPFSHKFKTGTVEQQN